MSSEANNKIPHIYFDTNFVIDISSGKSLSCHILEEAKKKKWRYYVSIFCMMEAFDIKQEHFFFNKKVSIGESLKRIISKRRERDLSESDLKEIKDILTNKLFKPHEMDHAYYFEDSDTWKMCLEITRDTNITASDAIHLATALALNCDILITSDIPFIIEGNRYIRKKKLENKLVLCTPEKFYDALRDRGFV